MRTRFWPALGVLAWLTMGPAQAAQPTHAPVVVYRGPQSVPVSLYSRALTQPLTRPAAQHTMRLERTPRTGVTPLKARLPLAPRQLRPGRAAVQRTQAPVHPFFVMGMDRISLAWLAQSLPTLRAINATGMVVQVTRREDWQRLQSKAQASGLSLALYPDTGLKEAYGITTYPVLVVPQGLLDIDTDGAGGP